MIHRMVWNQTAYFGQGAIEVIPEELAKRGFTKAFVVSDPVLIDSGVIPGTSATRPRCARWVPRRRTCTIWPCGAE